MSQKYFLISVLALVVVSVAEGSPVESTTVKILVPPPDMDDDDAVVIEAGTGTNGTSEDLTSPEFNVADCLLAKSKGPCRAVIDSWFYNKVTKSCEQFQWSGCGGNNNRFSEKEFCQLHCSKEKLTANTNTNAKPNKSAGASNANSNTTCPPFEGCGPLKCGQTLDPDTGCQKCACNFGGDDVNRGEKKNVKAPIGSVSGNPEAATTTSTKKPVERPEEVCHLPEIRGNCRAMMTRWRYNPEIKECVQFHFGGCDGNPNNFVSQEKCNIFCRGQ